MAARPLRLRGIAIVLGTIIIFAACTAQRPGTPPPSLRGYLDSIPGTLVTFEMMPLPERPLWIGRTEVTWDMYDVFALGLDTSANPTGVDATARPSRPYGAPDYGYGHQGYPVISVTRAAAEAFCNWLSVKTGRKYRLPTEVEWVHAATFAAGASPLTPERLDELAWSAGNAGGKTHPVGSKARDAVGLYDLFGNAAEWVITTDGQLVLRGGSFRSSARDIGPHAREVQDANWNERDPQLPKSRWWLSDAPFAGFRIVREPDSVR